MPLRRRPARRPARKSKPYKKRAYRKRGMMNAMKDRARVVEVEDFGPVQGNVGQQLTWQLNLYPRALAVAKNYRYYRCSKVEFEFVPYANIASQGQAFPELYYQTDTTAAASTAGPTLASMQGRGVLPVKWTSVIKKSLTPAILRFENMETASTADVIDVQPVTSTPVKYKWYMTDRTFNPSQVQTTQYVGPSYDPTALKYRGAVFFVNTPIPFTTIGKLLIRTHWDFKQPLVSATTLTLIYQAVSRIK